MTTKKEKCEFCNKSFLNVKRHKCVKKKRWESRNTQVSLIAFKVYCLFFWKNFGKKDINFKEFINSKFYSDFMKFAEHLIKIKPVDADGYARYLINSNFKMKDWFRWDIYQEFLEKTIYNESPYVAVKRSLKTMKQWAKKNNMQISDFFEYVNPNEASLLIQTGRISPWILYMSSKSEILFNKFTEDHINIIKKYIDAKKWRNKIQMDKSNLKILVDFLEENSI